MCVIFFKSGTTHGSPDPETGTVERTASRVPVPALSRAKSVPAVFTGTIAAVGTIQRALYGDLHCSQ